MALTRRFGDFQPFLRSTERADARMGGLEAGFLTYSKADELDTETYQVSSFELAGRSDHLADPLCAVFNVDQEALTTTAPLESDADLMREPQVKDEPKSKATPAAADSTEAAA